jgi:LacI family transcriptional regulator
MMDRPASIPPKNLEDIANLCGVSRSTVSRVINNSTNVREETRQRVLKVIAEYNFAPNVAARILVTQRTHVLGVYIPYVVSDVFMDPYYPMLLQAISTFANAQDYDVMLWLRGQNVSATELHQRVLDNRITDGLILSAAPLNDPLINVLIERGRPYILNGRPWHHTDITNYVDAMNREGAQQAVEHLVRLGRRRIATITGMLELCSGYDRLIGYRDTLQQMDMPLDENLKYVGDFTERSGYMGMRCLLQHNPDAVFCASDLMALGAIRALREVGRRVPDDVAIVGFDDIHVATLAEPQLTTIRQSVQELGNLSAQGLIGLVEGSITPPYQVELPTQLVIRESCGYSG